MSLSDLPLLRPTVKSKKTVKPTYIIYGHILSIIGGFFMIVSGLFELFSSEFLSILGLLGGIFILVVELDEFPFPPLKDPLTRGLVWITLGFISFVQLLAIVLIFVAGTFYVVYHYQ